MEVPGGGSPAKEESIASVIGNASPTGPTAFFDPSGIGKFTRGQRVDTQISVYMPSTMRLEEAEGRYGPFWNPTNIPLTGMHVSSEKPVKFAVTLIEIRPKGQKFRLSAVMKDSGSGVVKISLLGGGNPVEYVVGADGTVSRN